MTEEADSFLEELIEACMRPVTCFHLPTDRLVSPLWECEICD